jgi:Xaa-Pro dipeptidase
MDHKDWVISELENVEKSLGFQYTPQSEIELRMDTLKEGMKNIGVEAVLVIQKMDYYYLSGTTQDGILFIPVEGKPLLIIRREIERARLESPVQDVVAIKSLHDLPSIIHNHWGKLPKSIGLELDMLPVKDYFRYQDLFPDTVFLDFSQLLRKIRAIKSPLEIELMKKAGSIGEITYLIGGEILKEGMTEIQFGGLLEAIAKSYGHEGLIRVRSLNYEAYTWHILSGWSGGIVSQSDSPMGGLGLSPAFPVGASLKPIKANEPILVDFGTCYHGYQADETRMFSIGKMGDKFISAYKACCEIHNMALEEVRPGAECDAIFNNSVRLAKKLGYSDNYLGPLGLQTRFIGHGVGLELNEFPFLAKGHYYPLEEGMTFAVEPKIVFPGEGSVGIENTVAVTKNGYDIITPLKQEILQT